MRSCPARWAIEQLLPRTTDPFGAAELGTATHQLFEDLFTRPPGDRGLATGASILASLHAEHPDLKAPEDADELARWRNEIHRRMVGLWEIEDPNTVTVVESEMHLNTDVFGIPFNGYIDRVDHTPDGTLKIVDYKAGTGKMKSENAKFGDSHGEQLRLYVAALRNHQPDMNISAAEVFYVFHRKKRSIDLSEKAMAGTQLRYEKSWTLLNAQTASGRFAMKTSPLCGWCPAATVCPSAIAAGKEPKVPMAEHGERLGIGGCPGATPSQVPVELQGSLDTDTGVDDTYSNDAAGYDPGADFDDLQPEAPVAPVLDQETVPPSLGVENETTTVGGASIMYEDKPWEETAGDGGLNLNAYAATAAFGLVELAVESLHDNNQKVSAKNVDALSETLAIIVEHVQSGLGITPSMQAGSHTRLRGALRTSLDTIPPPFGEDADEWELWVAKSENRIKAITKAAIRLWNGGSDKKPWTVLANTAPKLQAVQ
jgi:putative RecB family exonuclease